MSEEITAESMLENGYEKVTVKHGTILLGDPLVIPSCPDCGRPMIHSIATLAEGGEGWKYVCGCVVDDVKDDKGNIIGRSVGIQLNEGQIMTECKKHGKILYGTGCINCTRDKVDPDKVVIIADAGKEPDEGETNYVRG